MVILDYFLWTGEFYHDVKHWQNQYHSYISGIRASYLNRSLPSIDLDLWIENYFIKVQTIQYLHDLRHYQILNVYSRDLNISLVSCKTLCFFFLDRYATQQRWTFASIFTSTKCGQFNICVIWVTTRSWMYAAEICWQIHDALYKFYVTLSVFLVTVNLSN